MRKEPSVISRIVNARIVTPERVLPLASLRIDGGRITEICPLEKQISAGAGDLDAAGATLLPGFIDLHNHGALGHDTMELDPSHWRAVCLFLALNGVTLPTASAGDNNHIAAYLELAGNIMAEEPAAKQSGHKTLHKNPRTPMSWGFSISY